MPDLATVLARMDDSGSTGRLGPDPPQSQIGQSAGGSRQGWIGARSDDRIDGGPAPPDRTKPWQSSFSP